MPELNINANNARRQYRSVAFGTWKVGGARHLTERRSEEPTASIRLKCSSPDLHLVTDHPSATAGVLSPIDTHRLLNNRLGESSPNLSRLHYTHTQLSLGGLPMDKLSTSTTVPARDYFSSSEYCQYMCSREDIDSFNGNLKSSEPIQAAFRKSRRDEISGGQRLNLQQHDDNHHHHATSTSKSARSLKYSQSSRRKYETTTTKGKSTKESTAAHHRSHSAGPQSTYSTLNNTNSCHPSSNHTASTSEMHRSGVSRNDSVTFLRATKRFFKKIYTSATLPKKQQQQNGTSVSIDNFHKSSVFFDDDLQRRRDEEEDELMKQKNCEIDDYTNRHHQHHDDLDFDDDDETMKSENATMDISYPDSGFEMDRASTPEQSSVSMTSTSKSDENSSPTSMNFSNLFEQLKREMKEMRERDAQILADLQRVESQIQTVKQAQILASLQDEFEPVESMQL